MHIVYRRLFRIRVRHGWYSTGQVENDFQIRPTASTSALLTSLGLRTRAYADGIAVFGEVEPGSDPAVLIRPVGAASIRLTFELRALNPLLLNVAELPAFNPGRAVFCFDNLREDEESGRLHLGDAPAGARIGGPVTLLSRGVYTHAFAAPAAAATLTLTDRFGAVAATLDVASPDPATPMSEYRLDVAALPGVEPGRYELADDQGTTTAVYVGPELDRSRPLGVIDIYTHTETLTPDATDRVPASYRFLSGDELTGFDAYYIQFDPRATTWRYIVTKKYQNNGIALDDLSIDGPVVFGGAVAGTRAVFTSAGAVPLSATARGLRLMKAAAQPVRDLPEPDLSTPLGRGATPTDFVSDMFVYV